QLSLLANERLVGQYVETGRLHLAVVQRLDQRPRVDEVAPRGVDLDDSVLHLREGSRRQHVPGLRQRRHIETDDVGLGIERRQIGVVEAERGREAWLRAEVVGEHTHLEAARDSDDVLADPPGTDYAQRLAGE